MSGYNKGSHTVYDIQYHIVWTTKYRNKVLTNEISSKLRELLRQGYEARGITIVRDNIKNDHVHMLLCCLPTLSVSKIVQYLKVRSSHLLQSAFPELKIPELKKRYCGQHLWAVGYFCRK